MSSLLVSNHNPELLIGKEIILDTDFLIDLFQNAELLTEVYGLLQESFLVIEMMASFEFLRNIFSPQLQLLRQEFLAKPFFYQAAEHQSQFIAIRDNALILSKIYSHHKIYTPSLTDLFLAGRVMYLHQRPYILTSNKKDYPNCVFNTIAILSWDSQKHNSIKHYYIVQLDQKKIDQCLKMIDKDCAK